MGGFEVRASPATTQAWRVLRRKRAAWRVLASVAWFVQFVAALVLGDSPGPVDLPPGTIRGGETQLTAGVVVAKLRGWPARREEFVARSLAVRLRGPAATMRGRLYVSDRDMVWIPDREWRAIDARDLLLRLDRSPARNSPHFDGAPVSPSSPPMGPRCGYGSGVGSTTSTGG